MSLRAYMDKENDPNVKSPNFKRNIVDIISKLQQKPKIEPASNKALTLLMAAVNIFIFIICIHKF